ncbi:MAG TPA: serine/threonine protein kinase, partial [Actinomycetota bacterium]|nr:serine/threonine protein kinase [Actinomycetota bacterium]
MASPGTRVVADRYVLRDRLGKGGMGTVWRADDEVLRRAVAVKEIGFPDSLDPAERDALRHRALREARAAAGLSHPSVVTVFDAIEHDDHIY